MAKKKKKSKRNPEIADRNRRIAIGSAVVIGAASVFVGSAMGVDLLDQRAAEMTVEGDPIVTIVYPGSESGESWMPVYEQDRLNERARAAVRGTAALTSTPLEEVGRLLAASGWAEGSPQVRWSADGTVRATLDWRVPTAAVRYGDREYLIDRDANLLPLQYPIGQSNQFYFTNTTESRPTHTGEQWSGKDLRDGLALLELLRDEDLLEQVEGIDLGQGRESGTLSIRTNRGAKIVWGGGPGDVRPGEQPTSIKTERLKALFVKTGRIDANVELVDIRGSDITLIRWEE